MVRLRKSDKGSVTPGQPSLRRLPRLALLTLSFVWPLVVTSSSSVPLTLSQDSATLVARAIVRPLARVAAETELAFPDDPPGSEAVTIPPTDKRALAFSVGGEVHQSYHIVFPAFLNVQLVGSQGSHPDRIVRLFDFNSTQNGAGVFPASGDPARASLGATRSKLRSSQKSGTYTGALPVTIVYP